MKVGFTLANRSNANIDFADSNVSFRVTLY